MSVQPSVFLVDDDPVLRDALYAYLSLQGLAVNCFRCATEFLAHYDGMQPGCLVTDVSMPGMNGLELQEALVARNAKLPIIFITGIANVEICVRAFKAGASDFIQKPFDYPQLLSLIREALTRDVNRYGIERQITDIRTRFERLTPRERDVMERVTNGESNKAIAEQLGLSPRTVELHRSKIYDKVLPKSVVNLVHMATVCGYVNPLVAIGAKDV